MSAQVLLDDTGAQVNWSVRENTTWVDNFTATLTATGDPIDITDITITAQITAAPTSSTVLKTFTVTKTNAALGQFKIRIDETLTTLSVGTYWWSMQWNDGTDDVPLCAGNFVVQDWSL
jgi:hypothetical protein